LGYAGFYGSALLRVVAGIDNPASGAVTISDRPVGGLSPARRDIGMVPAGGGLLPQLTVRENIAYGLRLRASGHRLSRHDEKLLATLVADLGLESLLHRLPNECTVAERLSVSLARAMTRLPSVVAVDLTRPGASAVAAPAPAGRPRTC
jgi:ABC-type sugar transport system ATPase subunit